MLSNLQEFLMQFPQYGKERSARAIRVYDELQETMFSWLFPDEAAEHELARTSKHLAGCRLKNALPCRNAAGPERWVSGLVADFPFPLRFEGRL
jgi:hypothetical protein